MASFTQENGFELTDGSGSNFHETYDASMELIDKGLHYVATCSENVDETEWVYWDASDEATLAQADAFATSRVKGIAIADKALGADGRFRFTGWIEKTGWALTPSSLYYLDPATPGAMTTVKPSSPDIVVELGESDSTGEKFYIRIRIYSTVGTGSTTFSGDVVLDDAAGDSPQVIWVGGSNDDRFRQWLEDDAVAGNSDLVLKFPAADGDSRFIFRDSGDNDVAYIDADGKAQFTTITDGTWSVTAGAHTGIASLDGGGTIDLEDNLDGTGFTITAGTFTDGTLTITGGNITAVTEITATTGSFANIDNDGSDIAINDPFNAVPDTDATFEMGRLKIGWFGTGSDHVALGHYDHFTTTGYSWFVNSAGLTAFNSPAGQTIDFRISNATQMQMDATNLTLGGLHLDMDSHNILNIAESTHVTVSTQNLDNDGSPVAVNDDLTLSDGNSINLQEDITWTGATTENLILFPDDLANALTLGEGANAYITFDSTDGTEVIRMYKDVEITGELSLGAGGAIAAAAEFGRLSFRSDDVSAGAAGERGYIAIFNDSASEWNGALAHEDTRIELHTFLNRVTDQTAFSIDSNMDAIIGGALDISGTFSIGTGLAIGAGEEFGRISFRSDDVSAGASGERGYIAIFNDSASEWNGAVAHEDTRIELHTFLNRVNDQMAFSVDSNMDAVVGNNLDVTAEMTAVTVSTQNFDNDGSPVNINDDFLLDTNEKIYFSSVVNATYLVGSGTRDLDIYRDSVLLMRFDDGPLIQAYHDINFNTAEIYSDKIKLTDIGGYAIKITNETGAVTVAGQLVKADPANNDAVILTAITEQEMFGVFLDSGVADGAEAWVVISGIADVAMEDNTAATRGNWVQTSDTVGEEGYADSTNAAPPGGGVTQLDNHMQEVGHCIETVAAGGGGTHILARCIIHFN